MDLQQRINKDICYEFDKYQVILEYGRIFLDETSSIERKYRWLKLSSSTSTIITLCIEIVCTILGSINLISFPIIIALGSFIFLAFILYMTLRFIFRKPLGIMISKEERTELCSILDKLNGYLSELDKSIRLVDVNVKTPNNLLKQIDNHINLEKTKIESSINELSRLYGTLNPEWEKKARQFANNRLEQYVRFTIIEKNEKRS